MNTFAISTTGRKLHIAATEDRTVCGAKIRYSVADKAYSNNVGDSYRELMQMCPKCEEKAR